MKELFKNKDVVRILKYFLLLTASIWFLPHYLMLVVWIYIFVQYFNDRDEIFWLALFFILGQISAFIFDGNPQGNMIIISFGPRKIGISEITVIAIIIKYFVYRPKKHIKNHFSNWFLAIIIFSVWLFIYGYVQGMNISKAFRILRFMIPYGLLWVVIYRLNTPDKIRRVLELCGLFVIFILIIQVFELVIGGTIVQKLGGTTQIDEETADTMSRQVYGPFLILTTMIGMMVFQAKKWEFSSKSFAWIVMISGYISIILSATRGYWISSTILLLVFILYLTNLSKNVKRSIVIAGLGIIVVLIVPGVRKQLDKSVIRLETVISVAKGDEGALENEGRISERLPRVMDKYYERPVLGFGFSNEGFEYYDIHVSFASNMLIGGIPGAILWILFWLYVIAFCLKYYNKTGEKVFIVLFFGFLAYLISGNTSTTVFTYLLSSRAFYLAIYFAMLNNITQFSIVEHKVLKEKEKFKFNS